MSEATVGMRVVFLPANRAWGVALGDSLVDIEGHRIWRCPEGLQEALEDCGFRMADDGHLVSAGGEA